MKRGIAIAILAVLTAWPSAAQTVSPTELGAFLAGRSLPPTSPLARLQSSAEYQDHARQYAALWYRYDDRYFAPMRSWAATELVPRIGPTTQVTYLFSGPDLISALALFPSARLYALDGLEPVGRLDNPLELSPEQLHASLAALRKSTEVILNFSHFITKDMKSDLVSSSFQGVFPVMLVFLSFTDARIDSAERLTLRPDGTLQPGESPGGQPALRLVFRAAPGMPPAEVYYFQANIADSALKSNPAVLDWMRRRGQSTGYLKAASYLLHEGGFSKAREFLMSNCRAIVQDDSGIPLSVFRERGWQLMFFGNYSTPLNIFLKYDQPPLRAIYGSGGSFPLPFGFGYRWQKGESTLMLALPPGQPPRALPAPVANPYPPQL